MADNFIAYKHRGRWWEPIILKGTKRELQFCINQLRKRHDDYDIRKFDGLIQVAIPKDEYDRIEKRWHNYSNNLSKLSIKALRGYGKIKVF